MQYKSECQCHEDYSAARCTKETDMLWSLIESAVSGQVYRKEYTEQLVLALYSSIVSENEDYTVNMTQSRKMDLFNRFILQNHSDVP